MTNGSPSLKPRRTAFAIKLRIPPKGLCRRAARAAALLGASQRPCRSVAPAYVASSVAAYYSSRPSTSPQSLVCESVT
jgi:hypothetical protein